MKWVYWSLLALGAVLLVGLWVFSGSQPDITVPSVSSLGAEEEASGELSYPPHESTEELASTDPGERASAPILSSLSSHVHDSFGAPIAGAVITWTPLRPEFLGIWVGWANQPWSEIEVATLATNSGEDGRFELPQVPPDWGDFLSVLWTTHPLHSPTLTYVESVDGSLRLPPVIEMARGEAIEVRVVDPLGIPVEGAEVEQTTPIPSNAVADQFDPQARRILMRTTTTNSNGGARLAAWDGPLLLRATHEGLASEVWIGTPRPMVQLELRPTFRAGGRVAMEIGSNIEGEQRVVCQVQKGSQLQPLAIVPVSSDGWGPVTLPALAADRYRFRFEGWNAEVQEKAFDPPAAGSDLRVDFTLRAGVDVVTFVHGQDKVSIANSTSIATWEQDGLAVEAEGRPREDGYTFIRGVPPGVIRLKAQAPEYVPKEFGVIRVPEDPPFVLDIELQRGRRLEGRVLWNDEPVEDFEITSWPHDWTDHLVTPFRERSDGSFVLEAVSTGPVYLNASAQGAAPSETSMVDAGDLSPAYLTLELGDLVRGKGQVVDASSGEPLSRASIQPYSAHRGDLVAPWGPTMSVAGDGTFDLVGFAAGHEVVRFSAPGYSVHVTQTFASPGDTVDFGLISLGRRQDLVVQLISGADVDFTGFTAMAEGGEPLPERVFDETGRVVFEDVSTGAYLLCVFEGDFQFLERLVLLPGEEWRYTIPVGGEFWVRVSVDPDAALPPDAHFSLTLPNPERVPIRVNAPVTGDRVLEVSSFHTGEVSAELFSTRSPVWPVTKGVIQEGVRLLELEIDLDSAGQRFRIVDSMGQVVPGTAVRLYPWDGTPPGWNAVADHDGDCTMQPFETGRYRAYLAHPERGSHYGISVEVPRLTADPIPIVFAPDRSLELQLLDGVEPLAGLPCLPIEENGFARLPLRTTDATGVVSWQAIGAGRFTVQIRQPGFWPTDASVETLPNGQRTEVQVRRVGDLDVSVERVGGGSVAGLVLALESTEFHVPVSIWIEAGKVVSSSGSTALDGQGRLALTGLPRGVYRWEVEGAEGEVEVVPARSERLTVLIP